MRWRNDRRCGPRLRDNLSRFRFRRSGRRCGNGNHRRCRLCRCLWRRCRRFTRRYVALSRFRFLFFFLGQNGLHHVPGLGDMREINLGGKCLCSARLRAARMARRVRSLLEMRPYLVSLVVFDRTRVSLALSQAQFPEYIENLSAFDFQLARQIVNSNLAHPPLFRICYPTPLSRS